MNKDDDLFIWAYSRIDTVTPEILVKIREAGSCWLGIESGDKDIRLEVQRANLNL